MNSTLFKLDPNNKMNNFMSIYVGKSESTIFRMMDELHKLWHYYVNCVDRNDKLVKNYERCMIGENAPGLIVTVVDKQEKEKTVNEIIKSVNDTEGNCKYKK